MGKKILIIDDEPSAVTYLKTVLEDHGYQTICSFSAQEGYEVALDKRPDLITLDLLMPEKTGIIIYRQMKKDPRLKDIPIIVITAFAAPRFPMVDVRKLFEGRSIPAPDGVLEKPVDPEDLLTKVEEILGQEIPVTVH